jgi:hypothetical protein
VLVLSSITNTGDLVGLGFRVPELQKSEEKQGEELGVPRWEELRASMKKNIITS